MAKRLTKSKWIGKDRHLRVVHHHAGPFPPHSHDYFEVEIVLSGEGHQILNGREYPLRRGTVTWLSPADVHEVVSDADLYLWNVTFDETVVSASEQMRLAAGEHCRQAEESLLKRLDAAAFLLREEEKIGGLTAPLMQYFLTLCLGSAKEETLTPVRRAALYAEIHFRESPTLADAARVACLSPVYFGERFKQETGKSYVQFLNDCKLRYACQLLRRGFGVTEACFASGFGSLSGFLYTFKKQMHCTPDAFRRAAEETEIGPSEGKNEKASSIRAGETGKYDPVRRERLCPRVLGASAPECRR